MWVFPFKALFLPNSFCWFSSAVNWHPQLFRLLQSLLSCYESVWSPLIFLNMFALPSNLLTSFLHLLCNTHRSSMKQWAADRIHQLLRIAPLQITLSLVRMLTCQGRVSDILAGVPSLSLGTVQEVALNLGLRPHEEIGTVGNILNSVLKKWNSFL